MYMFVCSVRIFMPVVDLYFLLHNFVVQLFLVEL